VDFFCHFLLLYDYR
jgi:hypothetical protein